MGRREEEGEWGDLFYKERSHTMWKTILLASVAHGQDQISATLQTIPERTDRKLYEWDMMVPAAKGGEHRVEGKGKCGALCRGMLLV